MAVHHEAEPVLFRRVGDTGDHLGTGRCSGRFAPPGGETGACTQADDVEAREEAGQRAAAAAETSASVSRPSSSARCMRRSPRRGPGRASAAHQQRHRAVSRLETSCWSALPVIDLEEEGSRRHRLVVSPFAHRASVVAATFCVRRLPPADRRRYNTRLATQQGRRATTRHDRRADTRVGAPQRTGSGGVGKGFADRASADRVRRAEVLGPERRGTPRASTAPTAAPRPAAGLGQGGYPVPRGGLELGESVDELAVSLYRRWS